ncbi:MAG: RidA family protein [Clostridia bacterium]|nr:RidA family protein [Clostridia bacterium]
MAELKKVATDKAPAAIGPYSQAIVIKDMVYTSGQIPINPASGNVEATTIEEQAEQVMKNLGEVLKAAGSSFENAVKTTCFLADMNDFAAFNGVYAKYFTTKPARSCVAVKTLPKGVLVEVEVIAAL